VQQGKMRRGYDAPQTLRRGTHVVRNFCVYMRVGKCTAQHETAPRSAVR